MTDKTPLTSPSAPPGGPYTPGLAVGEWVSWPATVVEVLGSRQIGDAADQRRAEADDEDRTDEIGRN